MTVKIRVRGRNITINLSDTGNSNMQYLSKKLLLSILSFTLKQRLIPKNVISIEPIINTNSMRVYVPEGLSPNLGLTKTTVAEKGARNTAGIIIYFAFCQLVILLLARAFSNFIDEKRIILSSL